MAEINENPEKYTTGKNKPYYLEGIKSLAFAKKDYPKAIRLGKEHLEMKIQAKQYQEIQVAERFLYIVYKAIGNKDQALKHYENFGIIKDSIEAAQKVRVLSYYQTIYETEKRDLKLMPNKQTFPYWMKKTRCKPNGFSLAVLVFCRFSALHILSAPEILPEEIKNYKNPSHKTF